MMNKIILFILIFFLFACSKSSEGPVENIQPSKNWTFTLGDITIIPNKLNVPTYPWFPDGHITIVKDDNADPNSRYIMFWSEWENYRSVGPTPFPEDQLRLDPKTPIFGGRGDWEGYNNGGSWLNSVYRQPDNRLIGFYHAEDHWYPRNKDYIAWKSTCLATSSDNGRSWENQGQIVTSSTPKPVSPTWGGSGDACVIWHKNDNRWICYYQNHWIHMAISDDPDATPGSWVKYYEGDFTENALGGKSTPLAGLKDVSGSNPSVHYNTYLQLWIMVYHGWNPRCSYIASSIDGYNWSKPRQLVCGPEGGRAWYPTIIGESDVLAGEMARLYYGNFAADESREFVGREMRFVRND
jgi:hypothetical protein